MALVKAEAQGRIVAVYPVWRQANMTARAVELVDIQAGRALSSDEAAEKAGLASAWSWIKSVRDASGAIEAAIATMTVDDLAVLDVAAHPLWPAAV